MMVIHLLPMPLVPKQHHMVFFFNKDYKLVYTGSIDNQMEQN